MNRADWNAPFSCFVAGETSTERRIRAFGHLPEGWHFGEGEQFSPSRINQALTLYRHFVAMGLSITDAIPGLSGQIKIIAYVDPYKIEYVIEDDNQASFALRENNKIITKELHVEKRKADMLLNETVRGLWTTSDSLIRGITTSGEKRKLTEWPSAAVVAGVPQLFNASVWIPRTETGARLFGNIQQELQEDRLSFGNSVTRYSHPDFQ